MPSAVDPTPSTSPLQGAYTVFRDAVASCILDELAMNPPDGRKCLRFHRAATFFADPSRLLADLIPPPTFRIEVKPPSVQRSALFVSTIVTEIALTPLPTRAPMGKTTLGPLVTGCRLLLAPSEIPAIYVKDVLDGDISAAHLHDLRAEWADARRLAGLSNDGPEVDAYVVCRLQAKDGQTGIEVFWPRCLALESRCLTETGVSTAAVAPAGSDLDSTASTSPAMARLVDHDGVAQHVPPGLPESNDVWAWYKEETQRREDEKAEALRREQDERESAQRKEQGDATASDKPKHASSAPHPAAPINERTPMSLGTASTEAPSPAELLALPPGQGGAPPAELPLARPEESRNDRDPHQAMDIDFGLGFYPSPAEPAHQMLPGSSAPPSAPMSSIDAALSSFDWGDGTFGASSSAGPAALPDPSLPVHDHRYEDSMLLGLTDDDFSFFDATPVTGGLPGMAGSLAPGAVPTSALAVSEPHAFAPFVSTTVQHPATNTFDFDMLGIGSHQAVPFPMPHDETFIDSTLHVTSPASRALAVSHSAPSQPIDARAFGVPSPASTGSVTQSPPVIDYSPAICDAPPHSDPSVQFAYITFDEPITAIDDRYDRRHGKYGLPSPQSEDGSTGLHLVPAHGREKRRTRSWYEALCDPHVLRADQLSAKRSSQSKGGRMQRDAPTRGTSHARSWVQRRGAHSADARRSVDSEAGVSPDGWPMDEAEDSSDVDEADDGQVPPSDDSEADERASVSVRKTSIPSADDSEYTAHAAILAVCGEALSRIVTVASKQDLDHHAATGPRSTTYEMIYATFAEVIVYQRFLRRALLSSAVQRKPDPGERRTGLNESKGESAWLTTLSHSQRRPHHRPRSAKRSYWWRPFLWGLAFRRSLPTRLFCRAWSKSRRPSCRSERRTASSEPNRVLSTTGEPWASSRLPPERMSPLSCWLKPTSNTTRPSGRGTG